ncbi:MAG: nucleoid-associated protein, YbaB/EbfC family [Acidimicrobiaceae bacterium]|nr:nucleoid-associated protein, YbaB/EbfC family [Acidimicrobiaceae bacterium]|tara:strand:- start:50416 stop:50736 length:321 start_codon:yes stop_codon:yes gene_type:complete
MSDLSSNDGFLEQAQQIQQQLLDQRKEISSTVVEGSAGGGAVTVLMQADGTVLEVHIDPDAVQKDDITMLEDMVAAAFRDGLRRCGNAQAAAMARVNTFSSAEDGG